MTSKVGFIAIVLSLLGSVACSPLSKLLGMPDTLGEMKATTGDMDNTMGSMNNSMGKTTNAIHQQTLLVALQNLQDKSNWDELTPVPFKLMPYGKAFAQEAHADEIMDFFYLTIQELNQAKLDMGMDPQTGESSPYIAGSQALSDAITEKMAKITILSIIAGFTPDDVVQEILSTDVQGDDNGFGSGQYRDTALGFLALRAQFLSDVMLDNSVLASPLSDIGLVEEAIQYAQKLDTIAKLRFSSQIQISVKPSLSVADKAGDKPTQMQLDMSTKLDPTLALNEWKKIKAGMNSDLNTGTLSFGSNPNDDAKIQKDEQTRLHADTATVNGYLQSWGASPN